MKKSVAALALLFAATAAVAQTELKFADALPKTFAYFPAMEAFKAAADKGGKVKIELFPAGVLGDQKALMEATKVGSVDISVVASQVSQQLVPEHGIFGLPFVWLKLDDYVNFLQGPIAGELGKKMEPHGLKVLTFANGGGLAVMNSKRPVRTPDDMKGLKLRVMQDPMQVDMIKAMGGIPVPMGTTEVYSAIQQGQIDGNATGPQLLWALKNHEVAKYLSFTNHGRAAAVVVMNLKKWNALSADQKQWVTSAARDVSVQEPKRAFELERSAAGKLEKIGVKIVTDVDKAGFQKIADPYLDKLAKDLGPHADKIKTLIRAIN